MNPDQNVLYLGDTVVIHCQSFNAPTWRKDGNLLPKHLSHYTCAFNLCISKATLEDSGNYTCTGKHANGFFKDTAEVFVGSKLLLAIIIIIHVCRIKYFFHLSFGNNYN